MHADSPFADPPPTDRPQRPGCLDILQSIAIFGRQVRRTITGLIREYGLNDSELLLLWVCGETDAGGIAQNRLASSVGLSTAQVSGLVERLGNRGLIEERRSPGDRRRRLWRITETGRGVLDQVLGQLAPLTAAWQAPPAGDSQGELVRLVGNLVEAAAAVSDEDHSAPHLRVFPQGPPTAARSDAHGEEQP
jgi:DNA-binding MarR family transcriptional regulator